MQKTGAILETVTQSVLSRRTKEGERLMRDEKESWKGFTEEVTFELSFEKDE